MYLCISPTNFKILSSDTKLTLKEGFPNICVLPDSLVALYPIQRPGVAKILLEEIGNRSKVKRFPISVKATK